MMPRVVKSLLGWIFAGTLWASGCTGVNSSPAGSVTADAAGAQVQPPEGVAEPIYLMLVGEIAGQRGQFDAALDHYLQLVRLVPDSKVAERATQIALYVKDTEKALEAASLWAERDPGSLPAHRITAMLEIKAGNTSAAAEQLGKLLKLKDPQLENTLIELVKWMDAELPLEQGLEVMQELTEEFPKVPELHLAYALLASNKDALMTARAEVDRALALKPKFSRALMLRAQLLMQSGDTKAARLALERAIRGDPENDRLGLLYAQFLARTGDFKAAERKLKNIVDRDHGNHDARFALASVLMELGQFDRARGEFLALSGDPRWQVQADFSMGLIDARQGKAESALRQFDRVGPGPLEFDARYNAISALISLGRLDEARERMAKARQQFPGEALRLYLIESELLVKHKDLPGAFALLGEALEKNSSDPELLYTRGLVAEQLGKLDVMEADLRAILELKPDDPAALNALGFSLADHRLDRLDEAEKYIKQALEKRPDDPAILDSYGWVLYRKGQRAEALIYLRKAYARYPDPEIAAHLGEVLWESGRRAEAKKIWSEGLKKNPEQDDIKRVREKYPEAFRGGAK